MTSGRAMPGRTAAGGMLAGRVTASAARTYGGAVAACFALAWLVSLAWWLLLPDTRVVSIDIPPGTAAAIARGDEVEVIPDSLLLRRGDTLAVRNDDDVVHRIGWQAIPPDTTARIPVTKQLLGASTLVCSVHPSGSIGVSPMARPGIASTAIPTALAGVPTAVAAVVALMVVRRLGDDETATAGAATKGA